jgi:hypothetical protein
MKLLYEVIILKQKKLLIVQIIMFLLSAISIALTSITTYDSTITRTVISIIIGSLFWLGIIGGILTGFVLKNKIKPNLQNGKKIGIVCFFKNKYSAIFDVLMLVSFVISVIEIVAKSDSVFAIIVIALFIFSFEMHCVLNGKIFEYINSKKGDTINE